MPYYRRNVYVLSVTIFLASLSWNQIIPFLQKYLEQLGAEGSALAYWTGIVIAAHSLGSIVAQPFWGKLGDSYGRKPMIIRAGFCLAGIYYGMSVCQTPWQLVILRILNGALTGFIPGSYALIATNTPEEHAPRSLATAQTAANVGLIAGPMVGALLAAVVHYRGSMQVAGTSVLVSTFVVWWLVKEPNKVQPTDKTSLVQDFGIALRSPVQSSLLVVVALAWIFGSSISPYLVKHIGALRGYGPHWMEGLIFSLPAIGFLMTAHRWTDLGQRIGYEKTIAMGLVGGGAATAALFLARDVYTFAVIYFIAGLWLAALSPSIAAITCTRVEESFRGRAYGIQQSAGTLGALVAPLVAAQVGAMFGIRSIFALVGFVFLAGMPVFRMMVRRWGKTGETGGQ